MHSKTTRDSAQSISYSVAPEQNCSGTRCSRTWSQNWPGLPSWNYIPDTDNIFGPTVTISVNPNLRYPSTAVTAIHNIIGLGIKIIATYPIESAVSLDSTISAIVSSSKPHFSTSAPKKEFHRQRARSTPKSFPWLQSRTWPIISTVDVTWGHKPCISHASVLVRTTHTNGRLLIPGKLFKLVKIAFKLSIFCKF